MPRTLILAAAIAAVALSGGAATAATSSRTSAAPTAADMPPAAGGPEGRRPRGKMRADANRDGVITRQEMIADANRRFDKLDTNRDGKLEATELQRKNKRARQGGARRGGADMPPPQGGYGDE